MKTAIDGVSVDVTTGAVTVDQSLVVAAIAGLKEQVVSFALEHTEQFEDIADSVDDENSDLSAILTDLIASLPASPNNADIIAELEVLHNLLFTSDSSIIRILGEVRDGLPTSPDNADIIAGLNQVIDALPTSPNNADIIAQLQVLINSLPASPNNADIVAKLNGVIAELGIVDADIVAKLNGVIDELGNIELSVGDISVANESIPQAIRDILVLVDNPDTSALHRTQLTNILNALLGLQDGFDLDELNNALSIFNENIEGIASIDDHLSISLESLFLQLRILSTHPELTPSQTNFLFPKRVYRNETNFALVNTKGNRNLIVLMGASNIDPASNLNYDDGVDTATDFNYEVLYPDTNIDFLPELGAVLDIGEQTITKEFESRFDFKNNDINENRIFNFFPDGIDSELLSNDILTINNQDPNDPNDECWQRYGFNGHSWRRYFLDTQTYAHYTRTYDVFESEFEDFRIENQLKNDVAANEIQSVNGTKRYIRIVETLTILIKTIATRRIILTQEGRQPSSADCTSGFQTGTLSADAATYGNIGDSGIVGGTARLSFEVKGADNEWYNHISSDEVGAITQGQKTKFEVGEAVSGHVLPSTQTHYRAKLAVTGGGIQTAVSLVRVA